MGGKRFGTVLRASRLQQVPARRQRQPEGRIGAELRLGDEQLADLAVLDLPDVDTATVVRRPRAEPKPSGSGEVVTFVGPPEGKTMP
jgi:hypothetical protein